MLGLHVRRHDGALALRSVRGLSVGSLPQWQRRLEASGSSSEGDEGAALAGLLFAMQRHRALQALLAQAVCCGLQRVRADGFPVSSLWRGAGSQRGASAAQAEVAAAGGASAAVAGEGDGLRPHEPNRLFFAVPLQRPHGRGREAGGGAVPGGAGHTQYFLSVLCEQDGEGSALSLRASVLAAARAPRSSAALLPGYAAVDVLHTGVATLCAQPSSGSMDGDDDALPRERPAKLRRVGQGDAGQGDVARLLRRLVTEASERAMVHALLQQLHLAPGLRVLLSGAHARSVIPVVFEAGALLAGRSELRIESAAIHVHAHTQPAAQRWECQIRLAEAPALPSSFSCSQPDGDGTPGHALLDGRTLVLRYAGIDESGRAVARVRADMRRVAHMLLLAVSVRGLIGEGAAGAAAALDVQGGFCVLRHASLSELTLRCETQSTQPPTPDGYPSHTQLSVYCDSATEGGGGGGGEAAAAAAGALRVLVSPVPPLMQRLRREFFPGDMYTVTGVAHAPPPPPRPRRGGGSGADQRAHENTVANVAGFVRHLQHYNPLLQALQAVFASPHSHNDSCRALSSVCELMPRSLTSTRLRFQHRLAVDIFLRDGLVHMEDVSASDAAFPPSAAEAGHGAPPAAESSEWRYSKLHLFESLREQMAMFAPSGLSPTLASGAELRSALLALGEHLAMLHTYYLFYDLCPEVCVSHTMMRQRGGWW